MSRLQEWVITEPPGFDGPCTGLRSLCFHRVNRFSPVSFIFPSWHRLRSLVMRALMLLLGVFYPAVLECSGLRWHRAATDPFIALAFYIKHSLVLKSRLFVESSFLDCLNFYTRCVIASVSGCWPELAWIGSIWSGGGGGLISLEIRAL